MTVLLDSSAWLEYFFGSTKGEKVKPIVESNERIVLSKINIFEVYYRILKEKNKEQAEKHLSFLLSRTYLDDLDADTLKLAAEEKQGHGLGMADAIILATALKHNAVIYTGDFDFKVAKDVLKIEFI